jgi:RNA polymerase sigma factor (sigma-70 family)
MEAASAVSRIRARALERECERLRPLGEAYLTRHFAGQIGRADAEDVIAEVLIRIHREARAGRAPRNLRAMFLTSAHNGAIDLLRARAVRPATVGLEAVAEAPDARAAPAERAESHEDAVRLQEALARMRANYRETILLRFGLGLTVPEIAAHFEISEAAAKKRLLRAIAQVRKRMAAIDAEEFCPQMRELARRSAFEKQASGLAGEAEAEALRAHFSHCGPCRSFLVQLRGELHDLGSTAAGALLTGHRLGGRVDLLHQLGNWAGAAADAAQGAGDRLRHLALRGAAPFSSGDGAAGAMMGTGQKIVAVCGVGATATATCLLSGAVGPGIGVAIHPGHTDHRSAPKLKRLSAQEVPLAPLPSEAAAAAEKAPSPETGAESAPAHQAPDVAPAPAPPKVSEAAPETSAPSPPPSEFGIEGGSTSDGTPSGSGSSPSGSAAESPPAAARQAPASGGGSAGAAGGGSGSAASAGGGSVGFQG